MLFIVGLVSVFDGLMDLSSNRKSLDGTKFICHFEMISCSDVIMETLNNSESLILTETLKDELMETPEWKVLE